MLEKDDLCKQYIKIQNRDSQYQHELRKKDAMFKNLQEQLRKYQTEKPVKNSFEVCEKFLVQGPAFFAQVIFYIIFLSL